MALGPDAYRAAHVRGAAMAYDEAIAFLRSSLVALAAEVALAPE